MGTETMLSMQQLIEYAEKECEDDKAELEAKHVKQECVIALRRSFQNFEAQLKGDDVDQMSLSSSDFDDQAPEPELTPELHHPLVSNLVDNEDNDMLVDAHNEPSNEPQLYLCDDWIRPVEVLRKPCVSLQPQDKLRARVAKSFLFVTLMSLNLGYGSLIEDYQRDREDMGHNPPELNSISQTKEEARDDRDRVDQGTGNGSRCLPAGLPPATVLTRHLTDVTDNSSAVAVEKDSSLKLHHVLSVKQSLREDLAEHSYPFS